METLIDRHVLIDSVSSICEIIPRGQLLKRQLVWPITVHFVGTYEAEWRVSAVVACGDKQVHRSGSVHIKIIVRNFSGLIVRWLPSRMDDEVRPRAGQQVSNILSVSKIKIMVTVIRKGLLQIFNHWAGRSLRSEEGCSHVIVDPDDTPPLFTQHHCCPN